MASLRLTAIAAATGLVLTGCGPLSSLTTGVKSKDYDSLSAHLKKDMSETEVAATLGSPPDKTDTVKCVDHAGNPWPCKTWIYAGGAKNTVRLVFYQADTMEWRVAAWQVY